MYVTDSKKYYGFAREEVADWSYNCPQFKGQTTYGDKSICHYCDGDPSRKVREAQRSACEKLAGEGRHTANRPPGIRSTRSQPLSTNRKMAEALQTPQTRQWRLTSGRWKGTATITVPAPGSTGTEAVGAAGMHLAEQQRLTQPTAAHKTDTAPTATATSDSVAANADDGGEGDAGKTATQQAKDLVADLEIRIRSASSNVDKRNSERLFEKRRQAREDVENAILELGKLQNQARGTGERLADTFKRNKHLGIVQDREIGKCRTAAKTIQQAEDNWEAPRKEHARLALEIKGFQALADQTSFARCRKLQRNARCRKTWQEWQQPCRRDCRPPATTRYLIQKSRGHRISSLQNSTSSWTSSNERQSTKSWQRQALWPNKLKQRSFSNNRHKHSNTKQQQQHLAQQQIQEETRRETRQEVLRPIPGVNQDRIQEKKHSRSTFLSAPPTPLTSVCKTSGTSESNQAVGRQANFLCRIRSKLAHVANQLQAWSIEAASPVAGDDDSGKCRNNSQAPQPPSLVPLPKMTPSLSLQAIVMKGPGIGGSSGQGSERPDTSGT